MSTITAVESFISTFHRVGSVTLPRFSGTRVMMMPLVVGELESVPDFIGHYRQVLRELFRVADERLFGRVGYITIDEREVRSNTTHRRPGLHVDGVLNGEGGVWGGSGGGGAWGKPGVGFLTVSNPAGCRAWRGEFFGTPGPNGECEHLRDQCDDSLSEILEANGVYWADGLCVHESLPMERDTQRTFLRLSLPNSAAWFDGYTVNPLGILPAGPIMPRREFMDQ